MFSPISLADTQGALLAAVTDVAENSLFAFADASDQAAFGAAAAVPNADAGWLRARIHFSGPAEGQFVLTLPVALARRLGASFAGAESADNIGEDELIDFTGELANMVCGTWLTRASQHEAFDLAPPLVLRAAPDRVKGERDHADCFYLAIDDAPIRLEIDWITSGATDSGPATERADAR